jgi:hypothetical protein
MISTQYEGIDVCKSSLDVYVRDRDTDVQVSNDAAGVVQLLRLLPTPEHVKRCTPS